MSSSVAAKVTSVQPEPKSVDPGGRSRQHVSSTVSVPGRYTWNEAVNRRNKHNRHNRHNRRSRRSRRNKHNRHNR